MKKVLFLAVLLSLTLSSEAYVPHRAVFPDILGYQTLKGDFHNHTVFSDDTTWPSVRIDEADFDGLDVISITDHMDSRHMKQVHNGTFNKETVDRNTSYKIAEAAAKQYGIIVIHGGELTRGLCLYPGHFNCHFITDGNVIADKAEAAAAKCKGLEKQENAAIFTGLNEARKQKAFIVWNHPDWERQAPNETKWFPIHTELLNHGLMNGIEIVNSFTGFDSEAFHWAVEKNLAIVSGTDCHQPMFRIVDYTKGEYRPMTLILASERSANGVREALDAGRTMVFAYGHLYGKAEYLEPMFRAMVQISDITYSDKKVSFKLKNNSPMPLVLTKAPGSEKVVYPRLIYVNEGEELTIDVKGLVNTEPIGLDEFDVNLFVDNFESDVNTPLKVTYHFSMPENLRK